MRSPRANVFCCFILMLGCQSYAIAADSVRWSHNFDDPGAGAAKAGTIIYNTFNNDKPLPEHDGDSAVFRNAARNLGKGMGLGEALKSGANHAAGFSDEDNEKKTTAVKSNRAMTFEWLEMSPRSISKAK